MVDKIEMSLDDIIKSNKPNRRGGGGRRGGRGAPRGGGRRGGGNFRRTSGGGGGGAGARDSVPRGRGRGGVTRSYTRGDVNSAWKHDLFEGYGPRKVAAARAIVQASMGPTKLMVSNLDFGVSDSDIQELFAEFGPLKSAAVHYDRSGRSLGTADVIFERRSDAIKAMKQYNGVPLDGRAMNIQLTISEIPPPPVRRINQDRPRQFNRSPRGGKSRPPRVPNRQRQGKMNRETTALAAKLSKTLVVGSGGRGGRNPRNSRKAAPTAEELDAELDAYTKEMK